MAESGISRTVGAIALYVSAIAVGNSVALAQTATLPTDDQVAGAFRVLYNHLGLLEYCADKEFVTTTDVANMRHSVKVSVWHFSVPSDAGQQEALGRRGEIIGPQTIGLFDMTNPSHPEQVREGQHMTMMANAAAQKSTEQKLCKQMAFQVAPIH